VHAVEQGLVGRPCVGELRGERLRDIFDDDGIPGRLRARAGTVAEGGELVGVRGATRLALSRGTSLISASHTEQPSLSGLIFDGAGIPLGAGRGLVHFTGARKIKISDCEMAQVGGTAILLEQCGGEVANNKIADADVAVHSLDARGLTIGNNDIAKAGNNGIQVWQSERRDDGTLVDGRGAIVGMEWKKAVTEDLVRGDSSQYPKLAIHGNLMR
jgi:uncharacterized secreted repeat protein (TIGR03808 family)